MSIERKTKQTDVVKTYEWDLCTEDMAQVDAFIDPTEPKYINIISQGWYWNVESLQELKQFIDTLIEEGPWK